MMLTMEKSIRLFEPGAERRPRAGSPAGDADAGSPLVKRFVFDESYREDVVLPCGTRVRLRLVRPSDKARLQEGLSNLSQAAVVARFFTPRGPFSRAELKYLTECDGHDHVAIGAAVLNEDGSEGGGIAVGRFVRAAGEPTAAEPAVVVLDRWQNRGLGRLVFDRLIDAARERGILCFRAEFLAGNNAIQRLLEGVCPDLVTRRDGDVLTADVPIPPLHEPVGTEATSRTVSAFLRLAAEGMLCLRVRPPRRWRALPAQKGRKALTR
jgi:GNAT superfamily N-acetyltransferase